MRRIVLTAEEADAGVRLDKFIGMKAENITRSAAERLIGEGSVLVGGILSEKIHLFVPC